MPKHILINVSRGSTVDEAALLHALEARTIKGAGLDVFWHEPRIDERFKVFDHVVVQPHHASGTIETRRGYGETRAGQSRRSFRGGGAGHARSLNFRRGMRSV